MLVRLRMRVIVTPSLPSRPDAAAQSLPSGTRSSGPVDCHELSLPTYSLAGGGTGGRAANEESGSHNGGTEQANVQVVHGLESPDYRAQSCMRVTANPDAAPAASDVSCSKHRAGGLAPAWMARPIVARRVAMHEANDGGLEGVVGCPIGRASAPPSATA